MTRTRYVCFFAAALCSFPQTYNDYMRKGAESFNKGEIDYALRAYEDALQANPSSALAKLHLSYVLLRQPDNGQNWNRARQLSAEVLRLDPANITAEWSLALLAMNDRKPAETTARCTGILAREPKHPECLFATAVASWMSVWPEITQARQQMGMSPVASGPIPDAMIRDALRNKYDIVMAGGLARLTELRELYLGHQDAAAYQNLIQRTRAAMASTEEESRNLIADADRYVGEALALRRSRNAEMALVLDPAQLPPMATLPKTMVPAPPPPPPPAR